MNKNKTKIGNFLISKEGSEIERIKIESVSNNWNMKVPSFNSQFKFFEHLLKEESTHAYFEAYINIMYMTANMMPDLEFLQDYMKIYNELVARAADNAEPTDEQDKENLDAAKESYEMQKDIENKE